MTYVYRERWVVSEGVGREPDVEHEYSKAFKTLAGATNHGCRRLKSYGYQACSRFEGSRFPAHIVAEWKRDGKIVAWVQS
jgi:hypothetical protein